MDAWATAADLAKVYRVSRGTVYAWASLDRWRRTRGRPKRYAVDDAQASYDRRHTAQTVAQPADMQAR